MSSHAFLEANPQAIVYSFDLGEYGYVRPAKEYIDQHFPGRHFLILGDSRITVPSFLKENPDMKFDLIFVDGGHDYEVAKADLFNMQPFSKQTTRLITDDLTPWLQWGVGPTKAWLELIEQGIIEQRELWKDGIKVDNIAPPGVRSWVLGRYILDK
jgi:hypothetical protein